MTIMFTFDFIVIILTEKLKKCQGGIMKCSQKLVVHTKDERVFTPRLSVYMKDERVLDLSCSNSVHEYNISSIIEKWMQIAFSSEVHLW